MKTVRFLTLSLFAILSADASVSAQDFEVELDVSTPSSILKEVSGARAKVTVRFVNLVPNPSPRYSFAVVIETELNGPPLCA